MNWRQMPTHRLEEMLFDLPDDDDRLDDIADELDLRASCAADNRVAQALGCAFGEEPS